MPVMIDDLVALALPDTVNDGNEDVVLTALTVAPNDNRCVDVSATLASGIVLGAKPALSVVVRVCDTDLIALSVADLELTDVRVTRVLEVNEENALLVPDRVAERVDKAL